MKNLTILLVVLASAISTKLIVAQGNTTQLNPMVQIELSTSIKSDLLIAGRLMSLDIEDDLTDVQKLSAITHAFVVSEYKKSAATLALSDASTSLLISTGE